MIINRNKKKTLFTHNALLFEKCYGFLKISKYRLEKFEKIPSTKTFFNKHLGNTSMLLFFVLLIEKE